MDVNTALLVVLVIFAGSFFLALIVGVILMYTLSPTAYTTAYTGLVFTYKDHAAPVQMAAAIKVMALGSTLDLAALSAAVRTSLEAQTGETVPNHAKAAAAAAYAVSGAGRILGVSVGVVDASVAEITVGTKGLVGAVEPDWVRHFASFLE